LPCDTQRRTSAAACAAKPRESGDSVTSAARCARVALATHVCTKHACVCAARLCPCVRRACVCVCACIRDRRRRSRAPRAHPRARAGRCHETSTASLLRALPPRARRSPPMDATWCCMTGVRCATCHVQVGGHVWAACHVQVSRHVYVR
jgi:hypothetical protein